MLATIKFDEKLTVSGRLKLRTPIYCIKKKSNKITKI